MKRKQCWAIKTKTGKYVNWPVVYNHWEADRTILFRTKKFADEWLASNRFWNQRSEVVRVTIIIKEIGE